MSYTTDSRFRLATPFASNGDCATVRMRDTLLLHTARYRATRNYGVSTCVIAADSLSFDRCHVAFAMVRLLLHRERDAEIIVIGTTYSGTNIFFNVFISAATRWPSTK